MRLTISKKLILSFLGLTILVLIATLGLARWSFERGFLDYVNALEEVRLEEISKSLALQYIDSGNSWDKLTSDKFNQTVRRRPPKSLIKSGRSNQKNNLSPFDSQPPPPSFTSRPPPENISKMRPPPSSERGRRPPPHLKETFAGIPTSLFDMNERHIVGPPIHDDAGQISVLVIVEDKPVGVLKSAPRRHFESPQETLFSKQQFTTSVFIALFSLFLALIVSWLLTRALLSPVKKMVRGVSKLSSGDYSSRLNDKRDDELGDLMSDLDHLAHKLDESRSSRQRWLADISHELRTPITVLTGEIETLKDGIRPFNKQQLTSLDQEVVRLRHLVDDLYELSVSDIGGLRYTHTPLNIQDILKSIVDSTQFRAKELKIDLQLIGTCDHLISGDEQRLNQLFSNLIENSFAYTDAPGKLHISLSSNNKEVAVHLVDSPPGASESDCNKLFDPLYRQEKSRNRRTAGAGLGLAICKNIVEAHRGVISASPSIHGGIDIKIVLPSNQSKG